MTTLGRLRTVWSGVGGAPYYTNLYFGGITDNATAATATARWLAFLTTIQTFMVSSLVANCEASVDLIDDATGDLTGTVNGGGFTKPGTGGGQALPRFTMGLVQWNTAIIVNGRALRGRTFLPGADENLNDVGGVPVAGYVAGVAAAATTLQAGAAPVILRVWSRTHGTSSPVTGAACWSQWATLRSRRD